MFKQVAICIKAGFHLATNANENISLVYIQYLLSDDWFKYRIDCGISISLHGAQKRWSILNVGMKIPIVCVCLVSTTKFQRKKMLPSSNLSWKKREILLLCQNYIYTAQIKRLNLQILHRAAYILTTCVFLEGSKKIYRVWICRFFYKAMLSKIAHSSKCL